jgi:hypothetical protein
MIRMSIIKLASVCYRSIQRSKQNAKFKMGHMGPEVERFDETIYNPGESEINVKLKWPGKTTLVVEAACILR